MFEMRMRLSEKKMTAERSPYTFFILLGDVGGFNGAILIFPAYFMSFYSSSMYQQTVAGRTAIQKPSKSRRRNNHGYEEENKLP